MIVYISGPITGTDDYMEHFKAAEDRLRSMGHRPVNPAWIYQPFDGKGAGHDDFVESCRRLMGHCESICLLRGWQGSSGAQEELKEAQRLGLWVTAEEWWER